MKGSVASLLKYGSSGYIRWHELGVTHLDPANADKLSKPLVDLVILD
jgi:hypothetical protein